MSSFNEMLVHSASNQKLCYLEQNCQLKLMSIAQIAAEQSVQMQSAFYFLLSRFQRDNQKYEYGFQILLGNQMKRLVAEPKKELVEQGKNLSIQWELFQPELQEHQPYHTSMNCLWHLKGTTQQDRYHIELTYGEVKPRIVACEAFGSTMFQATMDSQDGYEHESSVWYIKQKVND